MSNIAAKAFANKLAPAVLAVMVGQRMEQMGLDIENPNEEDMLAISEWLSQHGLCPQGMAKELLYYIYLMLSSEPIAHCFINNTAQIMWKILGDQDSSSRPPALYYQAAAASYGIFAGCFEVDEASWKQD